MPPDPRTLILRCDATTAMGTGHVMRCLALAQAWQDAGGQPVFAMAEGSLALRQRLLAENIEVAALEASPGSEDDAKRVAELAQHCAASWVVVDGYQFGAAYQRQLKAAGVKLLFIDDHGHARHYCADLVLNQNAHAREGFYAKREPYTRLLLGPRYAMLRREFARWHGWKREIPSAGRKVLVTMGGSDPDNATARVVEALGLVRMEGLEAVVVVGGSNPHRDSLQALAARCGSNISLRSDVTNMAELMAWADVAVSAAGTTGWEMCALGLPAILVALAPNQNPIGQELKRRGIALYLGADADVTSQEIAEQLQGLVASAERRDEMSRRGRELIDGFGAARVSFSLRSREFRLRRAEETDCRLLWEWANDAIVRSVSFSPAAIPWEQHLQWFTSRLAAPDALIYMITDLKEQPVAVVRFHREGPRAVVSICLGPAFRGKGLGNVILNMANEELFRSTEVAAIDAYVKPENEASVRLFTRAGFVTGTTVQVRGQDAVHFVLTRIELS